MPIDFEIPPFVLVNDRELAKELIKRTFAPLPVDLPDQWAEKEILFDYSKEMRGPCNFTGRNYLRRPIRDSVNSNIRKQTKVFGRGNGKTLCDEVQICYKLKYAPGARGLGVYPATHGEGGSENFVATRLTKTIKASPGMKGLLPSKGQERFYLNKKIVKLNGSHYGFIGSNSGSQGVSNRLTDIYFDEMEKFAPTLKNEAGIDKLAEGSVEGVAEYQIHYSSTPTIETGLIWAAIQKSNLHLYFLPCPHCSSLARSKGQKLSEDQRVTLARAENFQGWMILLLSEDYSAGWPTKFESVEPALNGRQIPFASMKFRYAPESTKEKPVNDARNRDGSWNYDRAQANAHMECPHCRCAIRDYVPSADGIYGAINTEVKEWMDENGAWICVKSGEPAHVGYMINSLYAPVINIESTWGGRAVKFLTAFEEGAEALRTFINAILAGVFTNQNSTVKSIKDDQNFAAEDWTPLMTCDFQRNWPFLWFVVAKWSSFKLQPSFPLVNGKPNFSEHLVKNPALKIQCEKIVGEIGDAWLPLAEILRFDPRTGNFPMLDFLISKNINGETFVNLWKEQCGMDTMSLGRFIYREMGLRMPKGGDSEVIAAGHCELSGDDAWAELRDFQTQFKVGLPLRKFGVHPNRAMMIDSGYAEKNNPEVLRKCYETGIEVWMACPNCNAPGQPQKYLPCCWEWYDPTSKKFQPHRLHAFMRPVPKNSWIPYRGMPTERSSKDAGGMQTFKKWSPGDPFSGLREADKKAIRVLEAASIHYFRKWMEKRGQQKEIREAIKTGKTYRGHVWNVAGDCQFFGTQCRRREDFERQMNAKGIKDDGEIFELGTGGAGKRRYPDHLNDAAGQMQESLAEMLGFFSYEKSGSN